MPIPVVGVIKNGKIELLEPLNLPEGTKLLITLLSAENCLEKPQEWTNISLQGLERAYGKDEPEYTNDLIKEFNSTYEGK